MKPQKRKSIIQLLMCLLLLTAGFNALAQPSFCPTNIDFEQGNLGRWEMYSGGCCPINAPTLAVQAGRHTLTSGNQLDPYGGFPIVAPGSGSFSLKLGNASSGSQAERARYYIQVPNGTGKYILLFRYAIVLQDPNHAAILQPRFEVTAYDSATNQPFNCAQYSYVASSHLPGFTQSPASHDVFYKPWTTGTIDLSGHKGRTVAIDFASGDCGAGAHFGYGYVDMNCGLFQLEGTICDSSATSITFNAPPGYQSYEWRDGSLTNILGTSPTLVVPTPSGPTVFAVILTPYAGFGCPDTLYSTFTSPIHSSVQAVASTDTSACPGGKVMLDVSATSTKQPFTYQWSPTAGLSCSTCSNPFVTVSVPTTYQVIVTNAVGCSDTDYVSVNVDSTIKTGLYVVADSVCKYDPMTIVNSAQNNPPTKIQSWIISGGSIISGGGSKDTAVIMWANHGNNRVVLAVIDGTCASRDTVDVYVRPDYQASIPADDTICQGGRKALNIVHNSTFPLTFKWVPGSYLSCDTCQYVMAKPMATTTYTAYIDNGFGCNDTLAVKISIDTLTWTKMLYPDTTCVTDAIGIKNIAINQNATKYLWSLEDGYILDGDGTDSIWAVWNVAGSKRIIHRAFIDSCGISDTQYVEVMAAPRPDFDLPPYACLYDTLRLFPATGAASYKWTIDGHSITDTLYKESYPLYWNALGVKTLKLVVSNNYCSDSITKKIEVHPLPIAQITKGFSAHLCQGDEFTLEAQAGARYTYNWQPPTIFKTNNDFQVQGVAERTERVYLDVINQWGCVGTDSLTMHVKPCCDIFMPDAFSPNNDGRNDRYWSPELARHVVVQFVISNRRGEIVYDSKKDSGKGWDGMQGGKEAGQDTYNYFLKFMCNGVDETMKKGTFILVR